MSLIAASLALLVIYAGVKLLIQIKKEILGSSFRRAAWFFIIAGSLILICTGARCIYMGSKYRAHMMHMENKTMYNDENHY